jgi:hypothetical protein
MANFIRITREERIYKTFETVIPCLPFGSSGRLLFKKARRLIYKLNYPEKYIKGLKMG